MRPGAHSLGHVAQTLEIMGIMGNNGGNPKIMGENRQIMDLDPANNGTGSDSTGILSIAPAFAPIAKQPPEKHTFCGTRQNSPAFRRKRSPPIVSRHFCGRSRGFWAIGRISRSGPIFSRQTQKTPDSSGVFARLANLQGLIGFASVLGNLASSSLSLPNSASVGARPSFSVKMGRPLEAPRV